MNKNSMFFLMAFISLITLEAITEARHGGRTAAVGLGGFALGATLASRNRDRDVVVVRDDYSSDSNQRARELDRREAALDRREASLERREAALNNR